MQSDRSVACSVACQSGLFSAGLLHKCDELIQLVNGLILDRPNTFGYFILQYFGEYIFNTDHWYIGRNKDIQFSVIFHSTIIKVCLMTVHG